MSFITNLGLEYLLKDKNTLEDIMSFCKDKKAMCRANKLVLCKRILKVSGYTVPSGTDTCSILNELLYRTKAIDQKELKITNKLVDNSALFGSVNLKKFLIANGASIKEGKAVKASNIISPIGNLPDEIATRLM